MLKQSKKVIVVADSSKLGRVSPAFICPLSEVHMLITDTGATEEAVEPYRQLGIEVARV
jgi:DeoR family transcriptional regulator of aga operon